MKTKEQLTAALTALSGDDAIRVECVARSLRNILSHGGEYTGLTKLAFEVVRAEVDPPAAEVTAQCVFTCDGCGTKSPGDCLHNGRWVKPDAWFQRTDGDGTQLVCSRPCIDVVARKTGKTRVVLPI